MKNKKLSLIIILFAVIAIASCRKRDTDPSKLEMVSYPIIYAFDTSYQNPNSIVYYQGIDLINIFSQIGQADPSGVVYPSQIYYYSFPVGHGPASMSVHAYDSATASVVTVDTVFNGHYDPNTPGLYIYQFNAKSSTGFGTLVEFVIAVTNYTGAAINDPNGFEAIRGTDTTTTVIDSIANGLYINLDGLVGLSIPTFFVQTDAGHIVMANQPTNYNVGQAPITAEQTQFSVGSVSGSDGTVSNVGGVPMIQYKLTADSLTGQVATFIGL